MNKLIAKMLSIVFTCFALAVPPIASAQEAPVIIKNTWQAGPGDAIGIYGADFSVSEETAQVLIAPMSEYSEGASYELYDAKVLNSDDGVLTAELPLDMPKDNYVGFVSTTGGISEPFYINTPEIDWISEPEICKGITARIFGRNFLNPKTGDGSSAKLYLCSTDGEQILEAQIKAVTEYTVDFIVPDGVTEDKSYIVKYNNGASEYGLMALDESEAVPCVTDEQMTELKEKYGIEIAWASKLNITDTFNVKQYGASGDGEADDSQAVNDALTAAEENGGGIVYFPEGEYDLRSLTDILNIPDKVILAGDGVDSSVIDINKRIYFGGNYGGITQLTINSDLVRPQDNTDRLIEGYVGWMLRAESENMCFFAKNMNMKIADGSAFKSYSAHHIVFEDCNLDFSHYGPAFSWPTKTAPSDSFKTRFVRNFVKNTQRPLLMFGAYTWASDNEIVGENQGLNYEKTNGEVISIEHRITDMWGDNIYFGDNNVSGLIGDGRADYDDGCGEGICNQQNGRIALGTVASADANALDTGLDLDTIISDSDKALGKRIVGGKAAIMSGDGIGQIKRITAVEGTKIILDSEWEVVPKTGDAFVIDCGIPERNIIVNNNITAELRKAAIMFYCKSADNIIADNIATSSGGIWFGQVQNAAQTRTAMSYFNYVADNDLSGGIKDRPGGSKDNTLLIGPGDDDGSAIVTDASLPRHTSYYGNMYRGNIIEGTGTNLKPENEYNGKFMNYNGIAVTTSSDSKQDYANGTIVSNNTVTNSLNGVVATSLANNTLIYRNNFSGNKNDYNDAGSRNTVTVMPEDEYAEAVKINSDEAGTAAILNLEKNPEEENPDEPSGGVSDNPYSDIDGYWAKDSILLLSSLNVFNGYEDGTFRPNEGITRAEFISVVYRCLGINYSNYSYKNLFADVLKSSWYCRTVERAFLLGLIDKNMINNWELSPESSITREEMTSVVVAAMEVKGMILEEGTVDNFQDADLITPWAKESMCKAYYNGIIEGNEKNELRPTQNSTRAEAVVMVERMLKMFPTE